MDDIFSLFVIFGIVSSIVKWAKKKQASGQENQGAAPDQPWKRILGDVTQAFEEAIDGKPNAKPAQAPASSIYSEGTDGHEGYKSTTIAAARPVPYMEGGDGEASPYSLSGEGSSIAREPVSAWRGSLLGTIEAATVSARPADIQVVNEPGQQVRPALNLRFDRDSLVSAVVMHEILTRPKDRRRR